MNNPRNRNRLLASPQATAPATMPAIPDIASTDPQIVAFARAVKSMLDTRAGASNPSERWVTERLIEELGLRGSPVQEGLPADQAGIPVWTSRRKLVYVTPKSLAEALQEYLPKATENRELSSLRSRVAALASGMSATQVQRAIEVAVERLNSELREEIVNAAKGDPALTQRINSLSQQMQQSNQRTLSLAPRTIAITTPKRIWTIAHNMGRYPDTTVLDSTGRLVWPDIEYPDEDTVVVTHGRASSGSVLLK